MSARFRDIPDVQGASDSRQVAIDRVGIRGLRHPLQIVDRDGAVQTTVAQCQLTVSLHEHVKGTHMSRFVQLLNEEREPLSVNNFLALLEEMRERLKADQGQIELRFPFFVRKAAPVTGVKSLLDYEVAFIGGMGRDAGELILEVLVPVTSLCPCSKEISDYGAHNQRAHVTIRARTAGDVWIQDIIDLVERQASAELFSLLKRPDEKHVTEHAYDNPKFVEDMIRDVAVELNKEPRIRGYRLEVENFEAIHNHSAYAMIEVDKDLPTA